MSNLNLLFRGCGLQGFHLLGGVTVVGVVNAVDVIGVAQVGVDSSDVIAVDSSDVVAVDSAGVIAVASDDAVSVGRSGRRRFRLRVRDFRPLERPLTNDALLRAQTLLPRRALLLLLRLKVFKARVPRRYQVSMTISKLPPFKMSTNSKNVDIFGPLLLLAPPASPAQELGDQRSIK
jgi:hypothetical protein